MAIIDMTISDMAAALAAKEFSSVEATKEHLSRIEKADKEINAYIRVTPDQALAAAEASDKRRAAGETLGPLDGIPMALKDIICTKGVHTTCASKILESFVPP